eukprot:TRINITY_DN197497_c0_g1_i1.p1 TRINITY_DN197497_c0_g1~~TRINITY_DN197497_c0_g1_i1.p1  ORF type:complete len:927 (-),score=216.93 TRINITY_DN197497_c0_g1_i1:177-2957(-)
MEASWYFREFQHYTSCEINTSVRIRISHLVVGRLFSNKSLWQDLTDSHVTAQVYNDNYPLHSAEISTTKAINQEDDEICWDFWLVLPMKYRDLNKSSKVVVNIHGTCNKILGGFSLDMFTSKGLLRTGSVKCKVYLGQTGDGSFSSKTDGLDYHYGYIDHCLLSAKELKHEINSSNNNSIPESCINIPEKAHEDGYGKTVKDALDSTAPVPSWLNNLTQNHFNYVESISQTKEIWELSPVELEKEQECFLHMEFLDFPHPVVFEEEEYDLEVPGSLPANGGRNKSTATASLGNDNWTNQVIKIYDPEIENECPIHMKYEKRARGLLRAFIDPNLKPNTEERAELQSIISSPKQTLTYDELQLLWKFRFALTEDKKALTKFLLCVDWNDENEVKQATDLLPKWASISVADALKLLSSQFQNAAVREFAVQVLRKSSDKELLQYLLQLVQALRYEPGLMKGHVSNMQATLAHTKGTRSSLGSTVEFMSDSMMTVGGGGVMNEEEHDVRVLSPLAKLLIDRAVQSTKFANFLHWYLVVEIEDKKRGQMFANVHLAFVNALHSADEMIADTIVAQEDLMQKISAAGQFACQNRRDNIKVKISKLRKAMATGGTFGELSSLRQTIALPLNPDIKVTGVIAEHCHIFKSALYPIVIDFITESPLPSMSGSDLSDSTETIASSFQIIHKNGDDFRQDQLILQLFSLMDNLLKRFNLDLQLTTYRVLATSTSQGIMERVMQADAVSGVLKDYGSIIEYFKANNPPHVMSEVMDTYIKSTAGCCVMSYLLGIGDRHLDNILLRTSGHLLHIDFGYIFGADPKPYPPPMKLTKEMLDAMGGRPNQNRFKSYCCQAYTILRKHANLILNLLTLMKDAGIEALNVDPHTTIMKVQERFRLDLSDEQAERFFLSLIEDSVNAFIPVIMDQIHKIAVSMR